jgi:hypothetical protein
MNRASNAKTILLAGVIGLLSLSLSAIVLWPKKVLLMAGGWDEHTRRENRERWYHESHKPPPALLEIKTAAESGDPKAQITLAQVYASQQDFEKAGAWYRQAAEQGNIAAEFTLGEILLHGRSATQTSAALAPDPDEAVIWLGKAANQGDVAAQVELGGCYQRGSGVNADPIEAYKWFALAAGQSNTVARVELEHIVLRMTKEENEAGQRAAALFFPSQEGALPEPAYLSQLQLKGISQARGKRLAIVNNHTLAEFEHAFIKLNNKIVDVRCLRIETASVLIQVGPFRKQLSLAD